MIDKNKSEFLKKRAALFYNKKRNKAILDAWNNDAETLEAIGKRYSITRERVRQIIAKADRLGLEVCSHQERKSIKNKIHLKNLLDNHKEKLIENFPKKSLFELSKLLKISQNDLNTLKDYLIKNGELKVPIKRNLERYNELPNYRKIRRQSILDLKEKGKTIKLIANENACSTATIANEIKKMQSEGIFVPNTQKSGGGLSDIEISYRRKLIIDERRKGTPISKIAKELGIDTGQVYRFIRFYL